jgi:tRNA threonylcarbamoyladenosine modification (KEOPS) complex  Pcc1 subunit
MRARAVLTIDVSPMIRDAVVGALAPEVRSPPEGTMVAIQECGGGGRGLYLLVESDDLSDHRAAMNSYLGLLQATIASLEGALEKNKYNEQPKP